MALEEACRSKVIPEVVVDGDLDARISYIPEHLSFIVFELIKDAMGAVMRFRPEERDTVSIRATIVEGPPEDELIIRVSDCGGGVSDLLTRLAAVSTSPPSSTQDGSRRMGERENTINGQASSTSMMTTTFVTTQRAMPTSGSTKSLSPEDDGDGEGRSGWSVDVCETYPESGHLTGWPSEALLSVGVLNPATSLTDVLCSFSNIRRRLELENEVRREEGREEYEHGPALLQEGPVWKQRRDLRSGATTASSSKSPLLSASAQAGLGSSSKLEQLRRTTRFKGTVSEQIISAPCTDPHSPPAGTKDRGGPPPFSENLKSSIAATSLGLADTGLGMALARVYAEFFGGSLSFRSLDGHGQDCYLKVPKLGVVKEGGEDLRL